MRALAWIRLPDNRLVALGHGDFIGRVWSAALVLDDPRVSEGHAMVSLRGGELWLLALRRRVAVGGQSVAEVRLEPGLSIALADRLLLEVERVELPDRVLAVEAEGLPAVALPAVASLRGAAAGEPGGPVRPRRAERGVDDRGRVESSGRRCHPAARGGGHLAGGRRAI